jgi:hyperosmotically inducible protein
MILMAYDLLSYNGNRMEEVMKYFAVIFFLAAVGFTGCGKDRASNQTAGDQTSTSTAPAADNTARNERDRGGDTKTPGDQAENEADRKITQEVRQALTSDNSLSTNAQNVKIITDNGTVTLRGPVKSEKEKTAIESKAKQVAGVKKVDNQLEIAS